MITKEKQKKYDVSDDVSFFDKKQKLFLSAVDAFIAEKKLLGQNDKWDAFFELYREWKDYMAEKFNDNRQQHLIDIINARIRTGKSK